MTVQLVIEGRVARVRLDRPDAGNRLDHATMTALVDALSGAAESGADVLALTAAGPDFCVGRDGKGPFPEGITRVENLHLIVDANAALASFPGLSLATVQGRALGFGCGIAVQADLTIASESSTFGFDESRVGRPPRFVMAYLADAIGAKRALDLVATGRILTAQQAETFGIVNRVVPESELTRATEAQIANLLELDSEAIRTCKSYPNDVRRVDPRERGEYAFAQTIGTTR